MSTLEVLCRLVIGVLGDTTPNVSCLSSNQVQHSARLPARQHLVRHRSRSVQYKAPTTDTSAYNEPNTTAVHGPHKPPEGSSSTRFP